MIAIPNMDKPKSCGECDLWSNCFYPKNPYTEQDDYIAPDCPLIEIVRCGECKHSKVYALQSDAPMKRWCHKGHFPKEITDGYYCGDGERRIR